tara:strand:+ start:3795 stop:3992 length:198 start_codon:yes stop_codon:yes gene_type:complete
MSYKQTETKQDFFNILADLNTTAKQLQYDPIFEPSEDEVEMLDDLATRVYNLCILDDGVTGKSNN